MKTKDMILCALAAAITAVLAPVSLPIGPVSITLGVFAVMLSGGILKPGYAFVSQIVYILLGCAGLPVFSNFRGGFQVLAGPTGGYLVVYPFMALLIALCAQWYGRHAAAKATRRFGLTLFFSMLASLILCYAAGSLWFAFQQQTPLKQALVMTVCPFIPGDVIKAILAVLVSVVLRRRLGHLLNRT